jgi:hypothetical protein
MNSNVTRWVGSAPSKCDVCEATIGDKFIDGRVRGFGWATMCPTCHADIGLGLGLGIGQLFELRDGEWIKTEG